MLARKQALSVTDAAAERIQALLAKRGKPSVGVRVGVRARGCSGLSYTLEYADEKGKYDEVVEDKGVTILVDPKAVMFILGTEMDYVEEKLQSGFTFRNPNEKGRCGCGESFHVERGVVRRAGPARVKLFQIEEPDGRPADPHEPGAAIGIDAAGTHAEVAFSVGGNALILDDRPGFERVLPVPAASAEVAAWQELLEGARIRAERALARPVTHAVVVLAVVPDANAAKHLRQASERAGLDLLRLAGRGELLGGATAAHAAALLAEDLIPRPELAAAPDPG